MAYVGTFSSPPRDVLPTQVDLPRGNGGKMVPQLFRESGPHTRELEQALKERGAVLNITIRGMQVAKKAVAPAAAPANLQENLLSL
jgi:hypothetical protein